MYITVTYLARYLRTVDSFRAEDPWNNRRATSFHILEYVMMPERITSAIDSRLFEHRFGLRSEIDGAVHMLPDSLVYLWRKGLPGDGYVVKTPPHSLPQLLRHLEPNLTLSDYEPKLESLRQRRLLFWICLGILLVLMWSLVLGLLVWSIRFQDRATVLACLGLTAAVATVTAMMFWVDFRSFRSIQKRRFQQIDLALGKG